MTAHVVRPLPGLTVHVGDARMALARIDPASVDCCVTSPPYWGLRNYGTPPLAWGGQPDCRHRWGVMERGRRKDILPAEVTTLSSRIATDARQDAAGTDGGRFCVRCGAWRGHLGLEHTPDLYVQHLVEVFRGVRRALKPGGTLWLNLGDSYTSGGRDSRDPGRSKLHPAFVDWKRGDRPPTPPGLKPKDLVGIPWLVAFALRADGWWLRSDIVWAKPNPMPESVRDRPTRTHEYLFLLANSERYYYDADAVKEPCTSGPSDIRKMVEALPRIGGKHKNLQDPFSKASSSTDIGRRRAVGDPAGRNRRSVWTIATQPYRGAHFATYPERLVEPCILAGTSEHGCCADCGAPWERVTGDAQAIPGRRSGNKERRVGAPAADRGRVNTHIGSGIHWHPTAAPTVAWQPSCKHQADPVPCTVLDPFAGSGTTLAVARRLGRAAIGVELNADYVDLVVQRVRRGQAREAA